MAIKYKSFKPRNKVEVKYYIKNNNIRFPKLRVLGEGDLNLGVIDTYEALKKARELDLDLVVISEKAEPPVAKILDFTKFLYQENKKNSAKKPKTSEVKEITFGPTIGEGDLASKAKRIKEWIDEGNKVKVTVQFKGREVTHPEFGYEKLKTLTAMVEEYAKQEGTPQRRGADLMVNFIKK